MDGQTSTVTLPRPRPRTLRSGSVAFCPENPLAAAAARTHSDGGHIMSELEPHTITRILQDSRTGSAADREQIFALLYEELRSLARREFQRRGGAQTLQPTVLVHEAYLRLMQTEEVEIRDRAHFFALAASVMRRILIDHYRRRSAQKRGGDRARVTLSAASDGDGGESSLDLMALDEALEKLAELDPRKAQVVELRFFAGMSVDDVARALDVSKRTVEADWRLARAWLGRELER